jgi:hypothetical protein
LSLPTVSQYCQMTREEIEASYRNLVADAVHVEPVATAKFRTNREKNRDSLDSKPFLRTGARRKKVPKKLSRFTIRP